MENNVIFPSASISFPSAIKTFAIISQKLWGYDVDPFADGNVGYLTMYPSISHFHVIDAICVIIVEFHLY